MAVPLLDALGATPELPQVVQAIEHIARTLAGLAADGVSHRDIKPDNLFQLNGEWAVGDFGLVKYPEHESATRHGRRLGPNVPVQSDLSHYAREVTRLRYATSVTKKETERERLENLYREAYDRVHSTLTTHLLAAIEQAGLLILSGPRSPDGWVPENYGGGATSPCWGIEHLSSPWLAANIGVVHRTQPDEDLENLAVTVVLAMMTSDSQHNYIRELKHFKPGSLRLDRIIGELKTQLDRELPGIIAHFLTTYGQTKVPR